ncbi:MAG: serine/threonine protein kinase [Planctomycetes bacterium]|nr:serine/threonine protein kinase [Planctomycetota bacterium]
MRLFDAKYELLEKLGDGGTASIHLALSHDDGGLVVVKRLSPRLAQDALNLYYFRREYEVLSRLAIPGVPKARAWGMVDGIPYFTMDYVAGEPLTDVVLKERLSWKEGVELLARAARILDAVHETGVVHGDVKPGNILVDEARNVYLIDFGASSKLGERPLPEEEEFIVGTPTYLSPELISGGPGRRSRRSDIYALGVILYDLLTGRVPFDAESDTRILDRIEYADLVPPHEIALAIPRAISDVALHALARRPEERFASAREFAAALSEAISEASSAPASAGVAAA